MSRRDLVVRVPKAMAARLALAATALGLDPGPTLALEILREWIEVAEAKAQERSRP